MHLPELAQQIQCRSRQRNQAIPIAFGIADVHPPTRAIDIADLQAQPLAQTQPQTVQSEEEHPVTEGTGGRKQPPGFTNRDDVR